MPKIFTQKSQRGSSWLVAIPKGLFRAKGIEVGDTIEFKLNNGDIVVILKEKGKQEEKKVTKKSKKKSK